MTADGIFLISGTDLVVLTPQPYDKEVVLQRALAEHPEVIAGPTTSGEGTGKLLLVTREMGVPGAEGGGAVWSLDHLFLDADGIPVVVEVKRSSDIRIRREVVGQMLDYAANGVKYWPVASLQAALDKTARQDGKTSEELLDHLRPGLDPDEFWRTVEANLAEGRIRMVFVADALPAELVRIIEFLNEQMDPAEVLGVELRQYVGEDHKVYVPRVIGRTSAAVEKKGQVWDETSFLDAARARRPEPEVTLIQMLLDDVGKRGEKLGWGKAATPGVSGWYSVAGIPTMVWIMNVATGYLELRVRYVAARLTDAGQGLARLEEAAQALQSIPNATGKIEEARKKDWKTSLYIPFSDIAAGHTQDITSAINAMVDHAPATLHDSHAG